ncbi:MAG: hypothetical protein V1900_02200 [Candidatus Aenigmatarchaeota archaeon]
MAMVFQDIGAILSNLTEQTVTFLPNLVGAILLLIIGLVLGKVFGRVVGEILDRLKLDYYVTETEKPAVSLSGFFALITRWWIYVAFVTAAIGVLGVMELTQWMRSVLYFIPNIIGAAIIIIVSYVIGVYIKSQLKKTKEPYALIIGKVIFFFVMYVGIAIALPVLNIPAGLVNNILLLIIGSLSLGLAIALGLGLKDAISDVSKRYVKKMRL